MTAPPTADNDIPAGKRQDRSASRPPALQALIIQGVSLLAAWLILSLLSRYADLHPGPVAAALLQGAVAALLSRWRGLAVWWLFIQFLFPAALVATHALHLPPGIFLAAFVVLLSLYWTTFRTQVPLYLSGPAAQDGVAGLLPQDRPVRFIDIGSGLGGLAMGLALRRPDSIFIGIEVAPLPWLVSWLRARVARSRSRFIRGDYGRIDFACYDVVFAYLSPAAMPALWEKACAEMQSGTLLLSYEFLIPGIAPDIVRRDETGGPVLYGWRM